MRTPDEFWARVDRCGARACWEWQGSRDAKGYGLLYYRRRRWRAHRLAKAITDGAAILPGVMVCHHCDSPPCCNPAHLYLGTAKDNSRDAWRRGRLTGGMIAAGHHERSVTDLLAFFDYLDG